MKYLNELGIDDEVAKLAAAISRQQAKHTTYHFLKDIRSFISDEEIDEGDDFDGVESKGEKRKK